MSKSVRAAIALAIFIVLLSGGFTVWTLMQNRTLTQQYQSLQAQFTETQTKLSEALTKAKQYEDQAHDLNDKINQKEAEKTQIQGLYDELKRKEDDLTAQIQQAQSERDDWKNRVNTVSRERDGLIQQLKNRPKEIVYKDRPVDTTPTPAATSTAAPQSDDYWAGILKQKAALQLEIDKAKSDLDKTALQVADLKKQNSDLQLSIKQLTDEKEDIAHKFDKEKEDLMRKIKYGEDLSTNLSIELARARNDQKFSGTRAEKIKDENNDLQAQVKQLTSTKVVLEKTISRLTEDKENMQKKLLETENVIQGRIDEIWKIKQSVDQKLTDTPAKTNQMELPPIIVNASGKNEAQNDAQAAPANDQAPAKKAAVISVNESNNFVITDLGQDSGVRVGHILKAYRGDKEIATLEVIQVRKDICAADIKQHTAALRVGDVVKPILN